MFDNIDNLTIKGGCFEEKTTLENILKYRFNIVYGPNGTGKSSISRAMANFANGDNNQTNGYEAHLGQLESCDAYHDRVFVFNEDFVDKNVKIGQDGDLGAIVMVGDDANYDTERNAKLAERKAAELSIANSERKLYGDDQTQSIGLLAEVENLKTTIENNFMLPNDCADRRKVIKGNVQKRKITFNEVYEIKDAALQNRETVQQLSQKVNDAIKYLTGLHSIPTIDWHIPATTFPVDINAVNVLLSTPMRKAELNQDDLFLIDLIENHMDIVHKTRDLIIYKEADRCPLCHQTIEKHTLNKLKDFISAAITDLVDKHVADLQSKINILQPISWTKPQSPQGKLDALINEVDSAIKQQNKNIQAISLKLQEKLDNVYQSVAQIDAAATSADEAKLMSAVTKLRQAINDHNSQSSARKMKPIIEQADKANLMLTYMIHKSDFDSYDGLIQQLADEQNNIKTQQGIITTINNEINAIEQKMHQTGIAMDFINKCIQFIFFNGSRLRLVSKQVQPGTPPRYALRSRDKDVPVNRVSVGERNILALSYFFATLFRGQKDNEKYKEDRLIIIDDPVSSFDKGSRSGVIALMSKVLTEILHNSHSKVLILSHDRQTIKDVKSMRERIFSNDKSIKKWEIKQLLQPKATSGERFADLKDYDSDYAKMLENIYDFASATDEKLDDPAFIGIGNQMRQVMETFCKLIFNSDYIQVVSNNNTFRNFYIKGIENNRFRPILQGFLQEKLLREVMNSESHASTSVEFATFDNEFSPHEMQQVAYAILIFMYGISSDHLFGFLHKKAKGVLDLANRFIANPPEHATTYEHMYPIGTSMDEAM